MKKHRMLYFLFTATLSASIVMSTSACSLGDLFRPDDDDTTQTLPTEDDAQIRAVYDSYVQNCAEQGRKELSYEEWLASVKGEKGEDGNGWHYGNGTPSQALGKDGDLYLDYATWNVYTKDGGSWTLRGCIKGEKGEDGNGGEAAGNAELTIHFLELGNKYAGDCIFIQCGDVEVLIDGGSRTDSADTIERYVDQYCTDGVLEYVIVTHADQDHIAALAGDQSHKGLFERYVCKTIIDFPLTDKTTQVYKRYVAARDAEVQAGAVHYNALQCYNNEGDAKQSYSLGEGVSMNFLYNYYYDHKTSDENNYSVCMYIQQGEYRYLFTGDLEEDGERRLVANNSLAPCKLYKAGHHGSKTSSTEALLNVIRPEYVCICCCAGSPEYTSNNNNTFPTRDALSRIEKYTDNIFVTSLATNVDLSAKTWDYTSLNGNIVVKSDGSAFSVTGSNHSQKLKDTPWYLANRA